MLYNWIPWSLAEKPCVSLSSLDMEKVYKMVPEFPDFPDRWEPCRKFFRMFYHHTEMKILIEGNIRSKVQISEKRCYFNNVCVTLQDAFTWNAPDYEISETGHE